MHVDFKTHSYKTHILIKIITKVTRTFFLNNCNNWFEKLNITIEIL